MPGCRIKCCNCIEPSSLADTYFSKSAALKRNAPAPSITRYCGRIDLCHYDDLLARLLYSLDYFTQIRDKIYLVFDFPYLQLV